MKATRISQMLPGAVDCTHRIWVMNCSGISICPMAKPASKNRKSRLCRGASAPGAKSVMANRSLICSKGYHGSTDGPVFKRYPGRANPADWMTASGFGPPGRNITAVSSNPASENASNCARRAPRSVSCWLIAASKQWPCCHQTRDTARGRQ